MARPGARPAAWCGHEHPKEVRVVLGGECSVRCLGCGQVGPRRASIVAAREALLAARSSTAPAARGGPEEAPASEAAPPYEALERRGLLA